MGYTVIYSLNTRIDDQENLMKTMKDAHEGRVQQLLSETRHKIALYKAKVNSKADLQLHIEHLECQLAEERKLREEKDDEIRVLKLLNEAAEKTIQKEKCLKSGGAFSEGKQDSLEIADSSQVNVQATNQLDSVSNSHEADMCKKLDVTFIGNRLNAVDKYQGDIKTLLNECEKLRTEKLTIQQRLEAQIKELQSQQEEQLRLLQNNEKHKDHENEREDQSKIVAKELEKQEVYFRKKIAELLHHLSSSEEKAERYRKEIKQLEDTVAAHSKQICNTQEEMSRLAQRINDVVICIRKWKRKCQNDEGLQVDDKNIHSEGDSQSKHNQAELLHTKLGFLIEELHNANEKIIFLEQQVNDNEFIQTSELLNKLEETQRDQEALQKHYEQELELLRNQSSCKEQSIQDIQATLQKQWSEQLEQTKQNYEVVLEEAKRAHSEEKDNLENQINLLHVQLQQMVRCESEDVVCLHLLLEEKDTGLENMSKEMNLVKSQQEELQSRLDGKEQELSEIKDALQLSQEAMLKICEEHKQEKGELARNYQLELNRQAEEINIEWIEKIKILKNQLVQEKEDTKIEALEKVEAQKEKEFEEAKVEWQNSVVKLTEQITALQKNKMDLEDKCKEEQHSKSELENESKQLKTKLQEMKDYYKECLMKNEIESEKLKIALKEKDSLMEEKEKQLFRTHQAELDAQAEAYQTSMQKMKCSGVENYFKKDKECDSDNYWKKEKFQSLFSNKVDNIQGEFCNEKIVPNNSQQYCTEIKGLRVELDVALQEIRQKGNATFSSEEQLLKDLAEEKKQVSFLSDKLTLLQQELHMVAQELELKRDEVLHVRNEATQQIRNLESYWQKRLIRELRKATHSLDQEKLKLVSDFNREQRLLKDKIVFLQSMLQEAERKTTWSDSLPEDVETIKQLQKTITEKDSIIYKLKEEKKFLHMELMNRESDPNKVYSSQPSVYNQETVFGLKKPPHFDRPSLTPQLVRRRNLFKNANTNFRARSQSPLPDMPSEKKATSSADNIKPQFLSHRASWAGESIADFQQTRLTSTKQSLDNGCCTKMSASCLHFNTKLSFPKPSESTFNFQSNIHSETSSAIQNSCISLTESDTLTSHICDTIAECDELLMSVEDEDDAIRNFRLEDWKNLPILESEI